MDHSVLFTNSLIFLIFSIIGCFSLSAFNICILKLGKFQTKQILNTSSFLIEKLFLKKPWERFYTLISLTKHLLYILYSICALLFLTLLFPNIELKHAGYFFLLSFCIVLFFLILSFFIRITIKIQFEAILKISSFLSAFYILTLSFITFPFLLLLKIPLKTKKTNFHHGNLITKDKVVEMINDSELNKVLSSSDQKTVACFITFKEKVAREIMIPRVDIFAIKAQTPIKEACSKLLEDNYSRIPVFQDNLDNIIGILMYKDVLQIYSQGIENPDLINQPVKNILKPIIYAPENKKLPSLFQEFKNKKIHLAIIVNEYGGTEGIVTIEDILEEVVGEIQDEYDTSEDKQFWHLSSGSILVDAKMSIIDLEEQLKIKIPPSTEYETLGGYIFHIAGTIPSKGWKLHLDDFEIEVVISNERCIEKVRIKTNYSK